MSLWSDLDLPDPVQSSGQLLDMHAQDAVRQLGLYGFIGERWFATARVEMGACCPSLQTGLHLLYRRCSQVLRCSIFGVSSLQTKHLLNCVTIYKCIPTCQVLQWLSINYLQTFQECAIFFPFAPGKIFSGRVQLLAPCASQYWGIQTVKHSRSCRGEPLQLSRIDGDQLFPDYSSSCHSAI